MENTPTITIILPVFNRRHLIGRAIDSVLAQSFSDWELLIMDDGSTDKVHELVFPLMDTEPRIRYERHNRLRQSRTRNLGMLAAQGEYITFLDSDDEYKPDHLALRLDYFKSNPDIDVIHGGVELVGPPESHYVQDAFHPDRKIHLSECTIGATLFGKRRVFIESGGFKPLSYSAESELVPRLMEQYIVERVNYPTYIYYTGLEDSICTLKQKGTTPTHD